MGNRLSIWEVGFILFTLSLGETNDDKSSRENTISVMFVKLKVNKLYLYVAYHFKLPLKETISSTYSFPIIRWKFNSSANKFRRTNMKITGIYHNKTLSIINLTYRKVTSKWKISCILLNYHAPYKQIKIITRWGNYQLVKIS